MASTSSPGVPTYRITHFYGPESDDANPRTLRCVFNVKKRSWKGGVQIVVVIEESQLIRVGKSLQFDDWLSKVLVHVPYRERSDYTVRAHDLLAQQVCYLKLQLAIGQGIRQENTQLDGQMLLQELEEAIPQEGKNIKDQILVELDIETENECS